MSNDELDQLRQQVNRLRKENKILKALLEKENISYTEAITRLDSYEEDDEYDPNQGRRIIHPAQITDEMANRFYARFWGRQDVYSKRTIKKSTGEVNYYPQCNNFWSEGCYRKSGTKIKCMDCEYRDWSRLTIRQIKAHLLGKSYEASDVIGVYPLLTDNTCRFLVFDFDNHEKSAEKKDFANTDEEWRNEVNAMCRICDLNGIYFLLERSRSGRGAHLWIFLDKPVSAALVRKFGFALLEKGAEEVNLKSFKYYDRMLPAQDHLPEGGLGNLIALPLQGKALLEGNSAFIDEKWNAYPDQWSVLMGTPRLTKDFLEEKIKEWEPEYTVAENGCERTNEDGNRSKPWNRNRKFHAADVDGKLNVVLSNGLYVDTINLKPAIQNQIRKLAAFSNPIFYKNQAIGLSNFENSRWIYFGKDENGYIEIPRGLLDELIEKCKEAGIPYDVVDERATGRHINVNFSGELRKEQEPAVEKLLHYDNGILHAATAFGKTVVCSALIAERKTSTLILLESSTLIDQWIESLEKFLVIEEEMPEYETKTGRKKKRKSLIGRLQGPHDSTTGIIDIAMVGSVCKKGEFHPRLSEYGMVMVDECHHSASDRIVNILNEVKAKYVYGVTATPMRGDGLEKINYMLIGPIRYQFTAKDKAKEQKIGHLVYPRFTRAVVPRGAGQKIHPNDAYEIIRNNEMRDRQIIEDVKSCVLQGRTPVVLTKYKDHAEGLYHHLNDYADHVFLMTGNNSKKEHKAIREQMQKIPDHESLILVATGKLVGEGFDFPRLDTLIMAAPVAWKGVVEQYAGRLNRDYEGKENVIVYDYVDSHIPMFDNMYAKRMRAYKQIGYEICTDGENGKQNANAIFDYENYDDVYNRDLINADKSIIISSPVISGQKVSHIISMLKSRQEAGVKVTIVTWAPDAYGYGKSDYWMELHERMRKAGFYVQLAEEFCEHYVIVDEEIVWYGSMNFLAKEDSEDNLMRVCSKSIAAELMEMTFGGSRGVTELR